MSWETVKLADLCTVITKGTTPSNIGATFTDIGVNYIRSEMITDAKYIASTGMLYIDKETHEKLKRSQLKKGDILFSMAGVYLGKTAILREEDVPANTNQAVALIRIDSSKCNLEYVYYFLNLPETVIKVNTVSGQAAQPNINLKQIGNIEILLPSLDKQNKIVNILSAYDDLIENNQKQIKLLEEAAQRLYKEWFVDLRFPGHENTPIIDGVPQGWHIRKLDTFGEIITGKTPSTAKESYYNGDIPFVKIPDMHNTIYPIITESTLSEEGANTQKNKFIPKDSLMVSCIATVGLVNISIQNCQTNQQINSIILNSIRDLYYLYFSTKGLKMLLDGVGSNGATMTNVNKSKFANIEVLYPTTNLRERFYDFCKPIFEKILVLSQSTMELKNSRDQLLPKLMSDELEV